MGTVNCDNSGSIQRCNISTRLFTKMTSHQVVWVENHHLKFNKSTNKWLGLYCAIQEVTLESEYNVYVSGMMKTDLPMVPLSSCTLLNENGAGVWLVDGMILRHNKFKERGIGLTVKLFLKNRTNEKSKNLFTSRKWRFLLRVVMSGFDKIQLEKGWSFLLSFNAIENSSLENMAGNGLYARFGFERWNKLWSERCFLARELYGTFIYCIRAYQYGGSDVC